MVQLDLDGFNGGYEAQMALAAPVVGSCDAPEGLMFQLGNGLGVLGSGAIPEFGSPYEDGADPPCVDASEGGGWKSSVWFAESGESVQGLLCRLSAVSDVGGDVQVVCDFDLEGGDWVGWVTECEGGFFCGIEGEVVFLRGLF